MWKTHSRTFSLTFWPSFLASLFGLIADQLALGIGQRFGKVDTWSVNLESEKEAAVARRAEARSGFLWIWDGNDQKVFCASCMVTQF